MRWCEAAILVLLVGLVSNAVDNLGLVFQLVGSTCGSMLMFIIPASMCLFGHKSDSEAESSEPREGNVCPTPLLRSIDTGLAWATMLFGLTILVGSNMVTYLLD